MLLLLSQQMSESRSPAALSRISRWSFIAQALTDSIAFACVGLNTWRYVLCTNILSQHITFAILADGRPSIALVAPAFLACALFAYEVVSQARVYFLDATYLVVGLQQFILLIQQVQAPEDLAAVPVLTRQTAPSIQSPSPPANTTNASHTGVPANGQSTTALLPSSPQNTSPQRPLRQEVTWSSFIRSLLRFAWYDEHNRICESVVFWSPPSTA